MFFCKILIRSLPFQKNIKLRKICYLRPDNIKCEKEVATIYKPSEDKLHNFRLKVTNN